MGNIFSNFCNNKLYDYFVLFHYVFLIFRYGKNKLKLRYYPSRQRSTVRSVITRRDKVHAYRAKVQSRFSRKQSLKRKIFTLYFRLLFSRRITPFPLVPPVTNHPVWKNIILGCPKSVFLSQTCFFTTVHLHTNVKPSLWNVAVFISTEQNESYVIRQNNINQKTSCVYYFLVKRKKLFGQPDIIKFWVKVWMLLLEIS